MKNGTICVVMEDMREDYRDEFIVGVEKQANRCGYSTVIFSMPMLDKLHTKNEEAVFELIDFERYDGVVFASTTFSAHKSLGKAMEKRIKLECKKPVVVIGETELFEEAFELDNEKECEAVTDHLIEVHGAKFLYFLGGQPNFSSGRGEGFMNSLKKHGLECTEDNMIYGGFWMECADKLAKDIAYEVLDRPDAVLCYDDEIAFFFIKALSRHGIRVPEDIIVAGFGARGCASNSVLSITTCPSGAEQLGRKAMSRLHHLITGEEEQEIGYPRGGVITGMSCGCGSHKALDVRLRLELNEKRRMEEMYYNNSELEEKLFSCMNLEELTYVLENTSYVVPDKCYMCVNVAVEGNTTKCIYETDAIGIGNYLDYDRREVYHKRFAEANEAKNIHVLPLCFMGKMIGHAAVGYKEPLVYNRFLKQYLSRISVFLEVMKLRNSMKTEPVKMVTEQPENGAESSELQELPVVVADGGKAGANSVLVLKDGALHRVPADNVLYFESEGRKTVAVLKSGRYEIKQTLTQLEESLAEKNFLRGSKSVLVNLSKVISIAPDSDRTLIATLSGKVTVRISRKHAAIFKEKISLI